VYGPALAALREIVAYAADLLLRSYRSAPGTCEDSVVIVCHFRQVVATADAATLLLCHGAAYMARLPARSLVEATIYLLWTLKQGKVRWGRQYYVASLRHYREWQLRGAGEANPHREAINRLWRRVIDEPAPAHPGGPSMAQGDIDEAEFLLGSDAFREINSWFDAERLSRSHEPDWFSPGPDGTGRVRSYAAMARELGDQHLLGYEILYDTLSDAVHGRDAFLHADLLPGGDGRVEFVRDPSASPYVFTTIAVYLLRAVRAVLREYRPAEMNSLLRQMQTQWVQKLDFPEVRIIDESDPG
jgi:hypothetical protein